MDESLGAVIDEVAPSEKTLLLVNVTDAAVEPQQRLLERVFDTETVDVATRELPEGEQNLVCLVDDGEVVATSPWSELKQSFLLINTDRYRTGTKQIETGSFPDVLTGLDEIEFTVRGYPASNKEKLLLVVISPTSTAPGECTSGLPKAMFRHTCTAFGTAPQWSTSSI